MSGDPAERTGLPDARSTGVVTRCVRAAASTDSNGEALDRLFAEVRLRLLRIVAVRTGVPVDGLDPDVEDIVQDALLVASTEFDPGRFPTGGALMRWLVTVAMNDVRDRARWRRVRARLEPLRTAMCSRLGDEGRGAMQVEYRELERQTDGALAQLDPADRELLLLRCYEGLSARELAEALEIPSEEAVRARVARARRRLAEILGRGSL